MFGLVLCAMLATAAPTDPGIASPGLDQRAPLQTRDAIAQLAARPDAPLPPGASGGPIDGSIDGLDDGRGGPSR